MAPPTDTRHPRREFPMPPPGRLILAIRRALHMKAELTSQELAAWAWPRGLPRDRKTRNNRYRALRRAAERVGLVRVQRAWPAGCVWRLGNKSVLCSTVYE